MALYTERYGIRKSTAKTPEISIAAYYLLLSCCKKYYNNLTHMFPLSSHHDFTNSDYLEFNENLFENRMAIKIPDLFRAEYNGKIAVPQEGDFYDQYALLDLIEFVAQNIRDISEGWNNDRYKNYWYIEPRETFKVVSVFQREINEILEEAGLLYTLTTSKQIERVDENSVLTADIEDSISSIQDEGTRGLVREAISLYKQPRPDEHQKATEKIWDALESLKTHFPGIENKNYDQKLADKLGNGQAEIAKIFKDELSQLGNIGNNYSIRHFNDKQINITDNRHYDYFFNRCLSLIALAIQYLK